MSKVYRVLIPLSQPQTQRDLITIGAAVAHHNKGEALAFNILLRSQHETMGPEELRSLMDEQNKVLAKSCLHTRDLGIAVTPVTLASSGIKETIIQETLDRGADLVIMVWSSPAPGAMIWNYLDVIAARTPADMAILKNRGLAEGRILLSTAGGPESHLGGQIAASLQQVLKMPVTLLHLVKTKEQMEKGRIFLEEFTDRYDLKARRIIKVREDFTAGILEESRFHDLIIIGGSRKGLFSKMFSRPIPEKVVEQADCSVLVTFRQGRLPFMTRFFGYR